MRAYCCTTDVITRPLLPSKNVKFPEIRLRLLDLMRADQELRLSGKLFDSSLEVRQMNQAAEDKRTAEMLSMLEKIKLPRAKYIGLDGSRAIWLLALHNPTYKNAGARVLDKMRYIFYRTRGDVFYPGIPYLVDRLTIIKNDYSHATKQYYGTQSWHRTVDTGEVTTGTFPIINYQGLAARLSRFDLALKKRNCRHTNGKSRII